MDFGWGEWDRTTEMTESKSVALPLGYTPNLVVEGGRFEPPNPKELIYSQPRLASSLPLHFWYSFVLMVDAEGLEPPTSAV